MPKLLLTTWILPVVQYLLANEAVVIACSCASYLFQADKPGTRAGLQSHQLKVLFIGLYLPAFYVPKYGSFVAVRLHES